MDITADSLHGVPILAITGDVDHSTARELDKVVRDTLSPDDPRVIVDLSRCRYIDSGGLAVFLYLVRRIRATGWVGVIGADPNLRRLFEIVGLTQEPGFRMLSGPEEATELVGAAES